MGQTKKRNYDRYTLGFKLQAVRLANHPNVIAKDVAESLGIHQVMLYRWQMEHRNGEKTGQPPLKSRTERLFRLIQTTFCKKPLTSHRSDGERPNSRARYRLILGGR